MAAALNGQGESLDYAETITPAPEGDSGDTQRTFKLLHVVGTRPNFMKGAPIVAAVKRWNENG